MSIFVIVLTFNLGFLRWIGVHRREGLNLIVFPLSSIRAVYSEVSAD
jgi:hypothetical protein